MRENEEPAPKHGVDGWELVEFDGEAVGFDLHVGPGKYLYEKLVYHNKETDQERVVARRFRSFSRKLL